MLVQPTEDEGDTLERQTKPQPTPSPPHPSTDQHKTQTDPSHIPSPTTQIPHFILKGSVSKQEKKPAKAEPMVHKDPAFDEL
ncbi:hypothetical protein Tco_1225814, partial [Tanacetum coccineum]